MTENEFWALIEMVPIYDLTDDLGGSANKDDIKALEAALAELSDADTLDFFHHFSTKLHALDTPAHYGACRVGGTEASEDVFLYARCHLLMLGRARYTDILNDPKLFPADLWFEDILSLTTRAYDRVWERDPDPDRHPNIETFTNPLWSSK